MQETVGNQKIEENNNYFRSSATVHPQPNISLTEDQVDHQYDNIAYNVSASDCDSESVSSSHSSSSSFSDENEKRIYTVM